jgi:hypothetical protein
MKKPFFILAVIWLAACGTAATTGDQERTYSVYESPTEKGKGTVPAYRVKEKSDGSVEVFKYGDPFTPEYTVKPNGSIYKKGDPFQRVGEIKPADKKGE